MKYCSWPRNNYFKAFKAYVNSNGTKLKLKVSATNALRFIIRLSIIVIIQTIVCMRIILAKITFLIISILNAIFIFIGYLKARLFFSHIHKSVDH